MDRPGRARRAVVERVVARTDATRDYALSRMNRTVRIAVAAQAAARAEPAFPPRVR